MANKQSGRAQRSVSIDTFCGMDRGTKEQGARDMVNFRIAEDGSLVKRCGYESVMKIPEKPRAVFSGHLNGEAVFYFLIGNRIYRTDPNEMCGYALVDTIKEEEGEASFASFCGTLYLFGGNELYAKIGGVFSRVEGYIPLYGEEWDPTEGGKVLECENLLTPRVRIRYRNPNCFEELRFLRRVKSVDRVTADGNEIPISEVVLSENGARCRCPHFSSYVNIEVTVTLETEDRRSRITSCRSVYVYGGSGENRLFCYNGSDKACLYGSSPVSAVSIEESEAVSPAYGGALYFPVDRNVYHVGAPVTALCRHYDRVLIFTASSVWAVDAADGVSVIRVHDTVGCDRNGCAVLCGEFPVSCFHGKLYRFSAKQSARNEYSAEALMLPMALLFRKDDEIRMCYHESVSELWITFRSEKGTVWVYHPKRDTFYRFSGVYIEEMIPSSDAPMLYYEKEIFRFDEDLTLDRGGDTVMAYYESGAFDLDAPNAEKHLVRAYVSCDPCGEEIVMRCCGEGRSCAVAVLDGGGENALCLYNKRLSMGRFYRVRVSFTANGTNRQRIFGVTLVGR